MVRPQNQRRHALESDAQQCQHSSRQTVRFCDGGTVGKKSELCPIRGGHLPFRHPSRYPDLGPGGRSKANGRRQRQGDWRRGSWSQRRSARKKKSSQEPSKPVACPSCTVSKLDHGHIREERRDLYQRNFPLPPHSPPIPTLITLLRHSCCRLFLTELWLPTALFALPDRETFHILSLQDTASSNEEEDANRLDERLRRQLELQHQEDIRLAQECVTIITSGFKQLRVVVTQQTSVEINQIHVESNLAMDLIDGLLKIKTLERLECRIEVLFLPEQWRGISAAPPSTPRLKHLNLNRVVASGQFFLATPPPNLGICPGTTRGLVGDAQDAKSNLRVDDSTALSKTTSADCGHLP